MKPIRDSKYLAWIRVQPCCVCGCRRNIEAAHVGPHGLGQKASDRSTVPLCTRHHRTGNDSLHALGRRKFEAHHNLSLNDIVAKLNTKPRIRIAGAWYYASFDGGSFWFALGRVDNTPIERAIWATRLLGTDLARGAA